MHRSLIAVAAVLAVAAAAAGATAAAARAANAPPKLTPAERELFQYAACMRKKGVNIPDPVRGKNGRYAFPKIPASVTSAPGVKKKAEACAAQLPSRRRVRITPAQRAAFEKFRACMAKNGVRVSLPTGQPRTVRVPRNGQPPPGGGIFNSNDPKAKKALAKCQKYMPRRTSAPGAR